MNKRKIMYCVYINYRKQEVFTTKHKALVYISQWKTRRPEYKYEIKQEYYIGDKCLKEERND